MKIDKDSFVFKYHLGSDRNKKLFNDLTKRTNGETDRGTVIIAASIIEEYLSECIKSILPFDSKSKIKKIFEYPGLLSSFSSKIEMSYCFGLFDENINTSLNILRRMRNECAHSIEAFDFFSQNQQLTQINNLGEGIEKGIKHFAKKMQAQFKIQELKDALDKDNVGYEDQQKILEEVVNNQTLEKAIEKPALRLEFLIGLLQISAVMEVQMNEFKHERKIEDDD